ncbi:MAG TPA: shikimate dehydrogenase [Dissulfurispiraceae bacterium]|nr:shikimate dehydrogenase [Dissulfurispiraceae bacterium]
MSEIGATTRIAALFGHPVAHSKSPRMHNAAFREFGMDCRYVAFDVDPGQLAAAVAAVRALGLLGVNLTIPHKEAVLSMLDEVDAEVQFIGAVNTIVNRQGRLIGYNTDGRGFMRSLKEAGVDVAGKRVLILGAGGAARAVAAYIVREAASVVVANRTRGRAGQLVGDLNQIRSIVTTAELSEAGQEAFLKDIHLVINATSLGLKESDPLPLDVDALTADQVVCDLIYHPTAFLQKAAARGARVLDGSGMLLWQGVLAFELWTGRDAPVNVMRRALLDGDTQ